MKLVLTILGCVLLSSTFACSGEVGVDAAIEPNPTTSVEARRLEQAASPPRLDDATRAIGGGQKDGSVIERAGEPEEPTAEEPSSDGIVAPTLQDVPDTVRRVRNIPDPAPAVVVQGATVQ